MRWRWWPGEFGGRVVSLVGAVTSPAWAPGADRDEQYRAHVTASLEGCPWARVVKVSDFTADAAGLFHTTGESLQRRAAKCRPLVPCCGRWYCGRTLRWTGT
jgi:hypothetical protein